MVEHDGHVGELLALLDDLKIADDTIVIYSTDNGAEVFTWPDGGTTPFTARRLQPGKADSEFRPWFAGLERFRQAR